MESRTGLSWSGYSFLLLSHFLKVSPTQFVFELLKVATPIPESQRISLMGDAEIAFSKLGKPKEDGAEPSKLEAQAALILKAWWFQTLLAICFIWAKREVIDYSQGGNLDEDEDDEDED
jgi:hypothetical protein